MQPIVTKGSREPYSLAWSDRRSILVVDDDAANLMAIEAALGELGRGLVKAHSGAEALRQLLQQDFALILLDVQMPSMDGFETARLIRARERTRHVPIIFITAYSREDREILTGYALGAVDFLFKPIVPEVLRAKATVFVELQHRAAEMARQAEMLRDHERREHDRRLATERQEWESEALRRRIEREREAAAEMARKADELAQTVAERERAEAELTRINMQLEEADRRKDEFLAMLAHELRNPLAPIVSGLELMRLQNLTDPVLSRTRDSMERQVQHLTRLVDDLLDVSRITSGKIELRIDAVDLGAIVELAVATSRPLIDEREHHLEVCKPPEPITVQADTVRLTQVISNLLNNAARYTDAGGELSVSYGCEGNDAWVVVTDNGRGIPEELVGHIFDVFVQETRGGGGLGLGLTLVQRITEMHGGHVSVTSEGVGKGSRFEVRLPADGVKTVDRPAAPPLHALREPEPAPVPPRGPAARVLDVVLIEDNDDIRETLVLLLERWGHRVRVAASGERGVELVLEMPPDVALVDIGLPALDGYGVARQICASLCERRPRLVAMTGYGQPEARAHAIDSGFDAHLVKPASPADLRRALVPE